MRYTRTGLLVLLCLAMTGCATLKLNPPSVSIAEISVGELTSAGRDYIIEFLVRNSNEQELPLTAVSFELVLEDSDAVRIEGDIDVTVAPFGTELVRLELKGRSNGPAQELTELSERGGSLSYRVSGHFISTLTEDPIRFQRRSQLHPTPGAPGKFRSGT